jgi:hypothetical protein
MLAEAASVTFASGAVALGAAAVALFFARFWRESGDRFFALFSLAFLVFAANRVVLLFERSHGSEGITAYLIRLAAFVLILLAILDKNRASRR